MDLCERVGEPLGQRHPWELARLDFFTRIVASELPDPTSVLDIGAGDAWFLDGLVERLTFPPTAVAWDINYTAEDLEALGRLRSSDVVRDAPPGQFDLVLLLDVIEHVVDDVELLTEAFTRLTARGRVIVSVPAWPRLYSAHDDHLGHERRYAPAQLEAAIREAGGRPLAQGGLFHCLLAPRAAQVALQRRQRIPGTSAPADLGQWSGGRTVTNIVTGALRLEGRAGLWGARRGLRLPGLSAWCVAERL